MYQQVIYKLFMLACTFLHFVAYVARLRGKASFSLSPCTLGILVLKTLFGSPRPFRCLLEIKMAEGGPNGQNL